MRFLYAMIGTYGDENHGKHLCVKEIHDSLVNLLIGKGLAKVLVKPGRKDAKYQDEEELDANAAHVNVEALEHGTGRHIATGSPGSSPDLNQECQDIQEHKYETKHTGFEAPDLALVSIVPDHASKDHVRKGIGPERSRQQKYEP